MKGGKKVITEEKRGEQEVEEVEEEQMSVERNRCD